MKNSLLKPISLMMAVLMLCIGLTACAGTAAKTDPTRSGDSGLHASSPVENDKSEDEIITEADKHGRGREGMLGVAGDVVKQYDGYLGYGYNILTAAFYNHKDIKTGHPVIDMDALAEEDFVYIEKKSSQHVDYVTYVSSSAKEYSEHFATAADIKARIGFTGSFKASFKMDHTMQMKSNQNLITTQALLETQNDFILDVDAKLLAQYATSTFKQADAEKTAGDLIDLYGTHVLANIMLGGRFDINYFYTSTETSESTAIETSAQASYRGISGGASGSDDKDRKEIETHSNIYFRTYGGSVTADPTSISAAVSSYKDWSKNVENGKITFVHASEVIPLWDIVAHLQDFEPAAEKSAAIKQYFDERVDQISNEFNETVKAQVYISDVYVGYGNSQSEAKNMLRGKGVTEGHIVNLDLNADVGGDWIYFGYKTTTDQDKAITGLVANYYSAAKSSGITYNSSKYDINPEDLTTNATGQ